MTDLQIVYRNEQDRSGTYTYTRLSYNPATIYRVDDSTDWHYSLEVIQGGKAKAA
jgi:hypothetical protein